MIVVIDHLMQRFPVFILWSLVGISRLQFAFYSSQDLKPRLESTLFNEPSLDDTTLTDQTITFDSNGFQNVDVLNSATESDLDWLSENIDSNSPDSNNLFSDISYSDGPDSSSLFAQHNGPCNVGSADDSQLFAKKRRDTSNCPSPFTGQTQSQQGSGHDDSSNQSGESNQEKIEPIFEPLSIFPEESDLCPPAVFKDSIIPVCRSFIEGAYMVIPGEAYVTLYNVAPLAPFILPKRCLNSPITKLWCCRDLVFSLRPFMALPAASAEDLQYEPLQEFQRVLGLKNFVYDAHICWDQSLIQFGEPVGGSRRGFKS